MRLIRTPAFAAAVVALTATMAGCGGGTSATTGGNSSGSPATITYWASNQGSSISQDYQVLDPVLKQFQRQTGIKVNVQVIGWPDLLNRILAATTSGQGPDVVNIGNTWSASLQATGAFLLRVVGRRDFVAGVHVWAFADFATAQADHRPESVNFKGVFTRDRRPKLAASRLRELWRPGAG